VLERRLSTAQQLLRQPKMLLADIALRCGFSSQTHMNDVFRERLVLHHSNIAATFSTTSEILHCFRRRVPTASYLSVYEWCAGTVPIEDTCASRALSHRPLERKLIRSSSFMADATEAGCSRTGTKNPGHSNHATSLFMPTNSLRDQGSV